MILAVMFIAGWITWIIGIKAFTTILVVMLKLNYKYEGFHNDFSVDVYNWLNNMYHKYEGFHHDSSGDVYVAY